MKKKSFLCNYCRKEFNRKDSITAHIKNQHELGEKQKLLRLPCNLCKSYFRNKQRLSRHITECHLIKTSVENNEIEDVISNLKILNNQSRSDILAQAIEATDLNLSPVQNKVTDDNSLKKTKKIDLLAEAIGTSKLDFIPNIDILKSGFVNENWKISFKCSLCTYITKRPSILKRHMAVHSSAVRYQCAKCQRRFKYLDNLLSHMKNRCRLDNKTKKGKRKKTKSDVFVDIDKNSKCINVSISTIEISNMSVDDAILNEMIKDIPSDLPYNLNDIEYLFNEDLDNSPLDSELNNQPNQKQSNKIEIISNEVVKFGTISNLRSIFHDHTYQGHRIAQKNLDKLKKQEQNEANNFGNTDLILPSNENNLNINEIILPLNEDLPVNENTLAANKYIMQFDEDLMPTNENILEFNKNMFPISENNFSTNEMFPLSDYNLPLSETYSNEGILLGNELVNNGSASEMNLSLPDPYEMMNDLETVLQAQADYYTKTDDIMTYYENDIITQPVEEIVELSIPDYDSPLLNCIAMMDSNNIVGDTLNKTKITNNFMDILQKAQINVHYTNIKNNQDFSRNLSHVNFENQIPQTSMPVTSDDVFKVPAPPGPNNIDIYNNKDDVDEFIMQLLSQRTIKMFDEDTDDSFKCDLCRHTFKSKQNLKDHKVTVHSNVDFICDVCSFKFKSKKALTQHIIGHSDAGRLKCKVCNVSLSRRSMRVHMYKHSDRKPYECPVCGKTFGTNSSQRCHIKNYHIKPPPKKPRKSNLIDMIFDENGSDKSNVTTPQVLLDCVNYLQEKRPIVTARKNIRGHVCSVCRKVFNTKSNLHRHEVSHRQTVPCECGEMFANKRKMLSHRLKCHNKERKKRKNI